jgi:hypothetical protein
MDRRSFQIYLLSKMRAGERVDEALTVLRASREDFPRVDAEAFALGLETPGHRAQLYVDMLGPPVRESPHGYEEQFTGSTRLAFALDVFPEVEFIVARHPRGDAFELCFARRGGSARPPLATAADLAPWKFVIEEVTARFGEPKIEDDWSFWADLSYWIPPAEGAAPVPMMLRFDRGLLQIVEPLDPALAERE